METISANEDVSTHAHLFLPSLRARDMRHHPTRFALFTADKAMIGEHLLCANRVLYRVEQEHLQSPAMNRVLGRLVADKASARLHPDRFPIFRMVAQLPRQDGGGLQTVLRAELVQHFGGVRQEIDSNPKWFHLRHRFEDGHLDSDAMKPECGYEPTCPSSDDQRTSHKP